MSFPESSPGAAPESSNPYASPATPGAPRQSSGMVGKVIAIVMLSLVGVSVLPFAFFFSCLAGGSLAANIYNPQGSGSDAVLFIAIGAGMLGVLATIVFFAWLIRLVLRTPTANAFVVPPSAPSSLPGENPFQDRVPPASS